MNTDRQHASREDQSKAVANNLGSRKNRISQVSQLVNNRLAMADNYTVKQYQPIQKKNNTGLPDNLKSGVENLSGFSMDDVKVHYNSAKPAQLNAHAYARGTDIHIAPGQERHLPHEAWHVVQQKQGRVKPTMQMKGSVNDDAGLEREADVMGAKATGMESRSVKKFPDTFDNTPAAVQAKAINDGAEYSEPDGKHAVVKNEGRNSVDPSNAPVQKQGWLFEKNDRKGEYPVLLMEEGALPFLEAHGFHLENRTQLVALRRLLDDPVQRYYAENILGAKELYQDILALAQPIATLSFNYRYHDNAGKGALKYDPVSGPTSASMDLGAVDHLRTARGSFAEPKFNFVTAIPSGCANIGRKIIVVPSVGCPEFLTNIQAVMHLQWAANAHDRPTFLFVPLSELETYHTKLGDILKQIGVGLVGWSSAAGLLGFGASRLAAQHFAFSIDGSRREAVMCDVNAVASKEVAEGYDTGEEEDGVDRSIKAVKGKGKYSAAGFGTGVPWYDYDAEEDELTRTGASRGGDTRPVEQVVIVGHELLYDPSFITSSEDADLTNALLTQEAPLHEESIDSSTFKYRRGKSGVHIEKVAMDSKSLSGAAYMRQRAELLEKLADENHILIRYRKSEGPKGRKKMVERVLPIGELAQQIADEHSLNQGEIRSLIIEKIILEGKQRQRGSPASGSASRHMEEDAPPSLRDVLHASVMSEAERIGADEFYEIGFADGTDHNCSIISIFKAAGVNISSEQAQIYRQSLNVGPDGDIDLTPATAQQILNLVTQQTGERYTLYVVHEDVSDDNPRHGVTKLTDNGGGSSLFIFFAGTHFSPAWHK